MALITNLPDVGKIGDDEFETQIRAWIKQFTNLTVSEINGASTSINTIYQTLMTASTLGIKYVWADAAERAAETGMSEGDQGLQYDTKIVYRYESGSWVEFYKMVFSLATYGKNALLEGNLSISNLSNALVQNSVIYTGTGATLNITTGIESYDANYDAARTYTAGSGNNTEYAIDRTTLYIWKYINATPSAGQPLAEGAYWTRVPDGESVPFKGADYEFKSRSATTNNIWIDTLRGGQKPLISNTAYKESDIDGDGTPNTYTDLVTAFTATGVTIGANTEINNSGATYVVWAKAYNKMISGVTNHGKRYIAQYDDVSNRGIRLRKGSGVVGHEVKTHIGVPVEFFVSKSLVSVTNWLADYIPAEAGLRLNSTAVAGNIEVTSDSSVTRSVATSWEVLDELYIDYYEASSNVCKIGTFAGEGSGTNIQIGIQASLADIKIITGATGSWHRFDNARANDGHYLDLDLTAIEATATDFLDFNTDSLQFKAASGSMNDPGRVYLYRAYADTNYNGGGSYALIPDLLGTPTLSLASGVIGHTKGYDGNGIVQAVNLHSGTITIDASYPMVQGSNWLWYNKTLDIFGATSREPYYGTVRQSARGDFYHINEKKMYSEESVTDLIGNRDGFTTTTGWTAGNSAILSVFNNTMKIENGAAALGYASKTFSTTIGQEYVFESKTTKGNVSLSTQLIAAGATTAIYNSTSTDDTVFSFVATETSYTIRYLIGTATIGLYGYVEFSLSAATSDYGTQIDRSYIATVEADANGEPVTVIETTIGKEYLDDLTVEKFTCRGDMDFTMPMFSGYLTSNIVANDVVAQWTTIKDTHNAMKSGMYEIPIDGAYELSVHASHLHTDATLTYIYWGIFSSAESAAIVTKRTQGQSTYSRLLDGSVSVTLDAKKGDLIYVASITASAAHYILNDKGSIFSIKWVGA